jgi:phosphoribosylaminoimidazolecarboxamide formyltransferase/IMP cyclohydrolase
MNKITRALISVSDKTGIVPFAESLHEAGVEILSTGGTAKTLSENGIPVVRIEDYTASPEVFDGRVKTLHPKIFGGILFIRNNPKHRSDAEAKGIKAIDLVVVDLYPFEKTVANPSVTFEDAIENIDIGGVSLIRAAAKNHAFVSILCSPAEYAPFLEELKKGGISEETNLKLARRAIATTARYDSLISSWLYAQDKTEPFPERISLALSRVQPLRYGENPHQKAAFYGPDSRCLLSGLVQKQGKELSFNNILDLNAAYEMVSDMDRHFPGRNACVIVKHNNPCGAALDDSQTEAFRKAYRTDPDSAFGGIIGFNKSLDGDTAKAISESHFDVICAPEFSAEALSLLSTKKNLRLVAVDPSTASAAGLWDYKTVRGGLLVQERDNELASEWKTITKKTANPADMEQLKFAFLLSKFVKSNAIVLVKDLRLIGMGGGQVSRVDSVRIAFDKAKAAGADCSESYLASDAFFPFPDSIERAAAGGVKAIVQPGGSVKDAVVFEAAERFGLVMVLTGMRHFRH